MDGENCGQGVTTAIKDGCLLSSLGGMMVRETAESCMVRHRSVDDDDVVVVWCCPTLLVCQLM